ncbi:MAG: hypothetical protein Kow00117_14180 [Phototrophicales bacterium]
MNKKLFLGLGLILWLFNINPVYARDELMVFAAASLTDAYEAIAVAFEAENPDVQILLNFGGSSTLAAQLAQGAPADIFASANQAQMQVALEAGRIAEPIQVFARNRLTLITPIDNPAGIQSLLDLASPDVRLIFASPGVPIRSYVDTLLTRLADYPAYGEAYPQAVMHNLVSEEPNVRQITAKVALGEADAAFVYASDVTPDLASSVQMIPFPDVLGAMIAYPIAATNDTNNPQLAQRFIDFVLSDAGQDILVEWGFLSIRKPPLPDHISLPTDDTLSVDGLVLNPLSLTIDQLSTAFIPQTVGDFTGVLLWDILNAAQPYFDPTVLDRLNMFVVITGQNGKQVVIAWAEIDPRHGNQPIVLAYSQNNTILEEGARLIDPAGRDVGVVVNINLRDAPSVIR